MHLRSRRNGRRTAYPRRRCNGWRPVDRGPGGRSAFDSATIHGRCMGGRRSLLRAALNRARRLISLMRTGAALETIVTLPRRRLEGCSRRSLRRGVSTPALFGLAARLRRRGLALFAFLLLRRGRPRLSLSRALNRIRASRGARQDLAETAPLASRKRLRPGR